MPVGLVYNGGKRQYADKIIQQILTDNPETRVFIDLFGGGGSVFYAAKKAGLAAFYNDFQPDLANLHRVAAFAGDNLKAAIIKDLSGEFVDFAFFHKLKSDYQKNAQQPLESGNFDVDRASLFWRVLAHSFSCQMGSYLYNQKFCNFYRQWHSLLFQKSPDALKIIKAHYHNHFDSYFDSIFEKLISPANIADWGGFYQNFWRPFYKTAAIIEFLSKRGQAHAPSFLPNKTWADLNFDDLNTLKQSEIAKSLGEKKIETMRFAADFYLRTRSLFKTIDFAKSANFPRSQADLIFSNSDWRDFYHRTRRYFAANNIDLKNVAFYADPPYLNTSNTAYCVFAGLGKSKKTSNNDIQKIFNHADFLDFIQKAATDGARFYLSEFSDFPQFRRVWQKAKTTYLGSTKNKRVDFLYSNMPTPANFEKFALKSEFFARAA